MTDFFGSCQLLHQSECPVRRLVCVEFLPHFVFTNYFPSICHQPQIRFQMNASASRRFHRLILLLTFIGTSFAAAGAPASENGPQQKIDSLQSLLPTLEAEKKLNVLHKIVNLTEDLYLGPEAEIGAIDRFSDEARRQKNVKAQADAMVRRMACYNNYGQSEELIGEAPAILDFLLDNGWTYNNDMNRFYCDLYLSEACTALRNFAQTDACLQRAALDAVAEQSGHGSYSPFFRAFVRKYGMGPSDYRRMSRTKAATEAAGTAE